MNIVCPTCNASYKVRDDGIPKKQAVATCKKCGGKIVFMPPASPATDRSSADSPLSPAKGSRPAVDLAASQAPDLLDAYPELKALDRKRFDMASIFSPDKKGRYKTRSNTFRLKILQAVEGTLDKALEEDENVLKIAKGTAYYPAEIFFGNGFLTMLYNHYAIVGTDRRLLFVNINARANRHTHYMFQMRYETIKKVKFGWVSCTLLLYNTKGKRRTFRSVKRYMGKEMKQFITERTAALPENFSQTSQPIHEDLCPTCFTALEKGLVQCPQCRSGFKVPKQALLKSLVLPGWGDMYLGHRILGAVELVGTVFIWAVVLSLLLSGDPGSLIVVCLMIFFYNGMDGLLTYHMAKKGYMAAS
jgi:predicted Zn finger-like uncharacterized protein